ncbi:DivIVA domain-containing protein [Anaerostipes sp.]|uniref:DivIVA domain-containing protein n=1 Tax=Anaerostipes sp. TaxID=1872530 RepID=UPI0025C39FAA|nr:DivIVA domain-containing protein [Anaerostipes sp.]MBS7008178.1 DivIVA domain-containing protein [Anaerostipes sp.]
MITPIELLGKELKRGFGYKAIEVDEFLEEVARDYEKVYKENNELKERVSALTENLDHYRVIEESLKKALVLAEETSKETIANADKAAKSMEEQAAMEAREIIDKARREAEDFARQAREAFDKENQEKQEEIDALEKQINKLNGDYISYKSRMLQFINGQLDYLNNPVYELELSKNQEKEETEAAVTEEPAYDEEQ